MRNLNDSADSDVMKAYARGKVRLVLMIPAIEANGILLLFVLKVTSVRYI